MDIIIDTEGQRDLLTKDRLIDSDDDDETSTINTSSKLGPLQLFDTELLLPKTEKKQKKQKIASSKDIDLDQFEQEMGWKGNLKSKQIKQVTDVSSLVDEVTPITKVLQKTVVKPGFEQLEAVPAYDEDQRQQVLKRRREREKTLGKKWFNLPAMEMTDEVKHDLEVIQMRSVLDPKRFYKKNDLQALPKYFQIGKVVDSPLEYYSGRITKKERKNTIVDELMADAQFSKYNKRKYKEIIDEKKKLCYKAHKHAKRLKRRKKH